MQHIEASVKIYFTREYSRFNMISGNRELNEKKINKIIAEIKKGNNMLKYNPIQVIERNGRLDIYDGQHRFYISRHLLEPVYYILVRDEKTMYDIAMNNSNTEKWNADNFINCYVMAGNENYNSLRNFMDTYGFSLGISIKLLALGYPGKDDGSGTNSDDFEKGKFKVNELEAATSFAETVKQFSLFPGWKTRGFVVAIHEILKADKYKISDLVKDFLKRPEYLAKQPNAKSYIVELEKLVNIGKHNRIIIA